MACEQPAAPPPAAVIAEGDTVVFDINGDKQSLIALDAKRCGEPHAGGGRRRGLALDGRPLAMHSNALECMQAAMNCLRPPARSKVKLGGVSCSATPLIGAPWGSMWTLGPDGKSLQRTS